MNKIIPISILLLILITGGCRQSRSTSEEKDGEQSVRIEGRIGDGQGQEVMIEEMAAREYIPADTAICDEDGEFFLGFTPAQTSFYALRTGSSSYITLLIEPGEQITLDIPQDNPAAYTVNGSPGSALLRDLSLEHKRVLDELGEIARQNTEGRDEAGFVEKKPGLDRRFDSICQSFHDHSLAFIQDHSHSLATLIALYNLYGQGLPVFHPEKDLAVYQFVDSSLRSHFPGNELVQMLHAQLREAEQLAQMNEQGSGPRVGENAPDFVSSGPDGREHAIRDYRGSYLILSFWAGWSRGSRDENAVLKEAWEAFGSKGLKILQVSFDGNKEVWTSAIREDGLRWDQVGDLTHWDSPLADLYGIERIPANYLIAPDGRVVAKDLFGDKLIKELEHIYR
jgi:peroxiredoxin